MRIDLGAKELQIGLGTAQRRLQTAYLEKLIPALTIDQPCDRCCKHQLDQPNDKDHRRDIMTFMYAEIDKGNRPSARGYQQPAKSGSPPATQQVAFALYRKNPVKIRKDRQQGWRQKHEIKNIERISVE